MGNRCLTSLSVCSQAVKGQLEGGVDAKDGEFPYHVFLKYNGRYFCSGALVSCKHALTAAHCVEDTKKVSGKLTALVGTIDVHKGGKSYCIVNRESHPSYVKKIPTDWMFDIGIFTLECNVEHLKFITVGKLPTSDEIQFGAMAVVSSAGCNYIGGPPSPVLQKLKVRLMDRATCQSMRETRIDESHICTYAPPCWGICMGDSGGPLVQNGVIIGIAAGSTIPSAQGIPDVYTKVFKYMIWIDSVIKISEST